MFKIIKISESQLLSTSTEEESKPVEKAEAKPVEKAEAKPVEKAVSKIKLIKFTPDSYDYQEDKVFLDLEILIASFSKHSEDSTLGSRILEAAKTNPQKAYEIALDGYVKMDHMRYDPSGELDADEQLKVKQFLGYKLNNAIDTFEECLHAIRDDDLGDTFTGLFEHEQFESKTYAELVAGLKRWDKKLSKLKAPPKPEKKEDPKPKKKEIAKPEKKEAPKPKGESSLLSEASMIKGLVKLSNHLDSIDNLQDADFTDEIIEKIARRTMAFDLDTGEVFDKSIKTWRHPTDGELADMFFGEDLGDVGDLNPDSISYKKDEDGNDGVLELRDEEEEFIAEIIVDEPPKNEISWHNLSSEHVESKPKNMTLPDGNSVTIEEIKLESNEMIKELVKLANHLDSKGFVKEADYLDGIIKMANETEADKIIKSIKNPSTNKDKAVLMMVGLYSDNQTIKALDEKTKRKVMLDITAMNSGKNPTGNPKAIDKLINVGKDQFSGSIKEIDDFKDYPSYKERVSSIKKEITDIWNNYKSLIDRKNQSGPAASVDAGPKTRTREYINSIGDEAKLKLYLDTATTNPDSEKENKDRILNILKTKMSEDKAKELMLNPDKEVVLKTFKELKI